VSAVTVYTRAGCHLCDEAIRQLTELQRELGFELRELDIETDPVLERAYFERIPVVLVGDEEVCELFMEEDLVRERLESRP
jgi:glutaredoxin